MPAKRVKPSEVAAAYGETVTEDEVKAEIASCPEHMPADHKKAAMQSLYGASPTCAKCGAFLKLGWIAVERGKYT